jgi:hypothetical protein
MMKKILFAASLFSLALAGGCAKGGNGVGSGITVTITDSSNGLTGISEAGLNLVIQFTATVQGTSNTAVTWTLTGDSCSGTGNPCGVLSNITSTSLTYTAPSTVPASPTIEIQAKSAADPNSVGAFDMKIVPITTTITPATPTVGKNLTQIFTATAVPDNAPQSFTWVCTANGVPCNNFVVDPNTYLAYYTAKDNCSGNCIQITAAATSDPTGCSIDPKDCTVAKADIVVSRLTGTFAFQFSGYDNSGNPVQAVGTFTASNGSITSGVEDEITSSGPVQHNISGGSYTPTSSDPNNSNNAGTLTLTTGAFPNQYLVVLDSNGDLQMAESDGHGIGSGMAQQLNNNNKFNTGDQTFAFGFTGVDSGGNRVGMAGLVPIDGTGNVAGGQMDVNDNANTGNICGTSPCSVAGSYSYNSGTNVGQLTLTTGVTQNFAFFLADGTTNANNPITIYAISTDPVDATHPAVSGTMVLQDSSKTYNVAALNGIAVSPLTGANSNVSLTLGDTDGKGNFSGQFDQNNAGTILAAVEFPVTGGSNYTYATTGTNGRYTIQMLGNPSANPVVPPLNFVFYASGVNRGFLLDQSSSSVLTGTMNPQPNKLAGLIAPSELPGTYALSVAANPVPSLGSTAYVASNWLLTSPGNAVYSVAGTQNPGLQAVAGTYSLNLATGAGTVVLTAPAAANYVIYVVDLSHFYMIDTDKGVSSPLFLAQD